MLAAFQLKISGDGAKAEIGQVRFQEWRSTSHSGGFNASVAAMRSRLMSMLCRMMSRPSQRFRSDSTLLVRK